MSKAVTVRDVAREAGVSVASVSHVLNGIPRVSAETRLRILEVIDRLGFQPNYTARSLATQRSALIGLVLPAGDATLPRENPFYADFIAAVEEEASRQGFDLIVSSHGPDTSCKAWVQKRNLEGVIFVGVYPERTLAEVASLGLPVVLLDAHLEDGSPYRSVGIDDEEGGYLATMHLLALGHRRIALVTGDRGLGPVNRMRFQGYARALRESGVAVDEGLIFEDAVSLEGGERIGERIGERLSAASPGVTAAFATADIMAFGLMRAFARAKRQVPEDCSIVGFDDLAPCRYLTPALTTIRQDIYGKGAAAVRLALGVPGQDGMVRSSIRLPLELVVRDSTLASVCEAAKEEPSDPS